MKLPPSCQTPCCCPSISIGTGAIMAFMAVAELAPVIEDRGIDEIYIDLTELVPLVRGGWARSAGRPPPWRCSGSRTTTATGLTCSIGLAPQQAAGRCCVQIPEKPGRADLRAGARRPLGSGPAGATHQRHRPQGYRTAARLWRFHTIGERRRSSCSQKQGRLWQQLRAMAARGRPWPRQSSSSPKATPAHQPRETTFGATHVRKRPGPCADSSICKRCAWRSADMARKRAYGRTVGIKIRSRRFPHRDPQ